MIDKLKEINAHLERASEILAEIIEQENEKQEKTTIQVILKGIVDDKNEFSEQLKKDLEEMLNDFTEKRES